MLKSWPTLLEQRIAPHRTWREILGTDFERLLQFLVPTGDIAVFVTCPRTQVTGCGWRVRQATDGSLIGFCAEDECAKTEFSRAELAMMNVDWPALLRKLGVALGIDGRAEVLVETPLVAQIGWIAPAQTARFAAFFCAPTAYSPLFPQLQRLAERVAGNPFAVVIPSRDQLDTDCLGLLASRKCQAVFMDEDVGLDGDGRLHATAASETLSGFARAGLTPAKPKSKFATPEGATWADLRISEVDNHTICITAAVKRGSKVRAAKEVYTFDQLGMRNDAKKEPKPVAAWDLLLDFIQDYRVIADGSHSWSQMKKQKEKLTGMLCDLTGLDADPFETGRRCYTPKFKVDGDPTRAKPEPERPRAIDESGKPLRRDRLS